MTDFLHPYGELDVLWRYGQVAPLLERHLKGKEIATKIVGEWFVLLMRGTKNPPLYIEDLREIDEDFLKLRAHHHLEEVQHQLTPKQILIRKYFVPRKLVNFFYACNNEHGKTMERIFIDIDRQNNSSDDARKVTNELIKTIHDDKQFNNMIKYKPLILRTWSSFHIYLLLKNTIDHAFYDDFLSFGKGKEDSIISRRASEVGKETGLKVFAGHERKRWAIILDTSNTPPGKLARSPFSLHIKDAGTIDGITIPITEKELEDKELVKMLQKTTPEEIWENIWKYRDLLR